MRTVSKDTICMKCLILFSGKIRKKIFLYSSFFPSSQMCNNNAFLLLVNNYWLLRVLENMLCNTKCNTQRKFFLQFLTGTKETNRINFCKITCSLSENSDQPAHICSLIRLCWDSGQRSCVSYNVKTADVQADLILHYRYRLVCRNNCVSKI